LAEVYTRLGHGAENATWRNFYLAGAMELKAAPNPAPVDLGAPDVIAAITVEQIFGSLAIRVDGPKAWNERFTIDWHLTDLDEHHRTTMSNGALIHRERPPASPADLTLRLTKPQLLGLIAGTDGDGVDHDGDMTVLHRLTAVLEEPTPGFAVVTP
ncbi:alkyl sulfatase C-terminal domain-containing protein, partial [Streptosporangium algeriense]